MRIGFLTRTPRIPRPSGTMLRHARGEWCCGPGTGTKAERGGDGSGRRGPETVVRGRPVRLKPDIRDADRACVSLTIWQTWAAAWGNESTIEFTAIQAQGKFRKLRHSCCIRHGRQCGIILSEACRFWFRRNAQDIRVAYILGRHGCAMSGASCRKSRAATPMWRGRPSSARLQGRSGSS